MIAFLKVLLVRYLLARYVVGTAGSLLLALPVAAVLKTIGAPLLAILGVVAVPVVIVLLVIGLPLFAVLLLALGVVALVAAFVLMGVVALKVAVFVVLPVMCVVWLVRRVRRGADASPTPVY